MRSPLPALGLLALVSSTFPTGASLIRSRGATVNGVVRGGEVELDTFTWLFIQEVNAQNLPPPKADLESRSWTQKDTDNLVAGAVVDMRRRHCATRLVADELVRRKTPVFIGPTSDRAGETDFRVIRINEARRGLLASVEGLGKLLYHEQLHILEKEMGLRDNPRGLNVNFAPGAAPHYPENVAAIVERLAARAGQRCPVSPEGQLLNEDGTPLELIFVGGGEFRRSTYRKLGDAAQEKALRERRQADQDRTRRLVSAMCGPGKFDCAPDR